MNEGKILLNVFIKKKIYTVFLNKQDQLDVFVLDREMNSYLIRKNDEIEFLNNVISNINRKYIRRNNIIFNGENITRYENKYNHFNFFATKLEDGTYKECEYEKYKKLYSMYNGIQVRYIDSHDFEDFISELEDLDDFSGNNSQTNKSIKKDNGIVKKVCMVLAGVFVTVSISCAGWNILLKDKIPNIRETRGISSGFGSEQKDTHDILGTNDIYEENENHSLLEGKYKEYENNLREAGLQNWEISQQLDSIAFFNRIDGIDDDISFKYDSDSDSIIYIYDGNTENLENETQTKGKSEKKTIIYSEKIQFIIDTINNNPNLSEDEKKFIIDTYGPIWQKNKKYINVYEIASRYKNISINYEYLEDGKEYDIEYTPRKIAAGVYSHAGMMVNTPEEFENYDKKISEINLHDSRDFKEVLENEDTLSTFVHELNHINGEFSYYDGSLLNEGFTQLSSPNRDSRYINEQYMCILFIETFGIDSMKEGYYGFDLEQALTNRIVEKTGKNQDQVRNEVSVLLKDVDEILYGLDKNGYSEDLGNKIQECLKVLSNYYKQLNDMDMDKNQIINLSIDALIGSHKSNLYTSEDEKILRMEDYDIDTGKIEFSFGKKHENVYYDYGKNMTFTSSRQVQLDSKNKYDENSIVKDEDINYNSR